MKISAFAVLEKRVDISVSGIRSQTLPRDGPVCPLPAIVDLRRILQVVVDFVAELGGSVDEVFPGLRALELACADLDGPVVAVGCFARAVVGFQLRFC